MSYLIRNDELIASTSETLKSGDRVEVAYNSTQNALDANRDITLVNSFYCKVSNAKKWNKKAFSASYSAVAVNDSTDEFLLSSYE